MKGEPKQANGLRLGEALFLLNLAQHRHHTGNKPCGAPNTLPGLMLWTRYTPQGKGCPPNVAQLSLSVLAHSQPNTVTMNNR